MKKWFRKWRYRKKLESIFSEQILLKAQLERAKAEIKLYNTQLEYLDLKLQRLRLEYDDTVSRSS